jgi:hypothetical protein
MISLMTSCAAAACQHVSTVNHAVNLISKQIYKNSRTSTLINGVARAAGPPGNDISAVQKSLQNRSKIVRLNSGVCVRFYGRPEWKALKSSAGQGLQAAATEREMTMRWISLVPS